MSPVPEWTGWDEWPGLWEWVVYVSGEVHNMAQCTCGVANGIGLVHGDLVRNVVEPLWQINVNMVRLADDADAVTALIRQLAGMDLSKYLGTADIAGEREQATVGGSLVQAQYTAALHVFGNELGSGRAYDELQVRATDRVFEESARVREAYGKGWFDRILPEINGWLGVRHLEPADAWGNIGRAYAFAAGLGLTAHAIAAASEITVFGVSIPKLSGLAAFVGQMAGFGPIANAVTGTFYQTCISEPWRYFLNSQFTPRRPGLGDILRLRAKRLLPGCMGPADLRRRARDAADLRLRGTEQSMRAAAELETIPMEGGRLPGYDRFVKELGYQGYSAEWAGVFEDDLYTEPRHFELLMMGQAYNVPEWWWLEKCRALGYTEQDAGFMVEGLKRKLTGPYDDKYMSALFRMNRLGKIDKKTLREHLDTMQLAPYVKSAISRAADADAEAADYYQDVYYLEDQYSRDLLTDEELWDGLIALGVATGRAWTRVQRARLKRYHKIWFKWPSDIAREKMEAARKLFERGRITRAELERILLDAGLDPGTVDMLLELEDAKRVIKVAGYFGLYMAPADLSWLRDRVQHGLLTLEQYRQELRKANFPAAYVDDEVALQGVKVAIRQAAAVRRDQLPAFRRAYVVGLVARTELEGVMEDAGIDPAGIAAEFLTLDRQREAELARQDAAAEAAAAGAASTAAAG